MKYLDFLKKTAAENNSIICFGLDPLLEKIPVQADSVEKKIFYFFEQILEKCFEESCLPSALKPNYAFFAQYGFPGLKALEKTCSLSKKYKLPLILDAKRGDIGKTSSAYAIECFEFWKADAVTVSPFMGKDSVMPFAEHAAKQGKCCYVLNRTSNSGAKDFQDTEIAGKKLFLHVSEKIVEWSRQNIDCLGAVVGATSVKELEEIAGFFQKSGKEIPLLVPGVGAQGGSAGETVSALKNSGYDLGIVRINSSSGISYAFEKKKNKDFAYAAAEEIKKLNSETGKISF